MEIEIKDYKKKAGFKNLQENTKVYEKYHSSLLNYLNGTMASSQTGPRKVGQMTELFESFRKHTPKEKQTVENWKEFYLNSVVLNNGKTGQEAINEAIEKNIQLKDIALNILNREDIDTLIKEYLEDLIFNKTFSGLSVEPYVCRSALQSLLKDTFDESLLRNSTPQEESRNIDFIYDTTPIQIKPLSFKSRNQGIQLGNYDDLVIIYYSINKNNIIIEIEENNLNK